MADRAKSTMGGSKKKSKGKKKLKEMHIRHAANGGYIVKHDKDQPQGGGGDPQPSEEHQVPDMAALQDHVAENMQQPGQPQPAPQAAAGPPMGMPSAA